MSSVRKKMILVGGIGVVVSACFFLMDLRQSSELTGYELERSEEGSGSREEELHYRVGSGESGDITLDIPETICTDAEVEQKLEEALERLDAEILGENKSLLEVDHDLNLMTTLSGSPVIISWNSDRMDIVDYEGLLGRNIPEGGTDVLLEGELTFQGQTMTYQRKITVYPPAAENAGERLRRMAEAQNQDIEGEVFYLPRELDGQRVIWERKTTHEGLILLILTGAAVICIYAGGRQEKFRLERQREEQMTEDYPEIVSKFLLLMGAGLSIRRCFERIANDYGAKQASGEILKRFAYEEITAACREMNSGIPESRAYENFGRRCGCPTYKNLATLLSQNLKKGSRGMIGLLEREAQEAFSERRRRAKVKGDKAQTKLLLPMVMMLAVVLVILMVPAYLSFAV